jgi:hypothetical protein
MQSGNRTRLFVFAVVALVVECLSFWGFIEFGRVSSTLGRTSCVVAYSGGLIALFLFARRCGSPWQSVLLCAIIALGFTIFHEVIARTLYEGLLKEAIYAPVSHQLADSVLKLSGVFAGHAVIAVSVWWYYQHARMRRETGG